MPLHPEFQAMNAASGGRELTSQTVEAARAGYLAGIAGLPPGPTMATVEEERIAGVPCRIYRPEHASDAAVVFFHGGGWVLGSLDGHDGICRDLAAGSGATVVSVDYRLAPEHPFPAAYEDAVAVSSAVVATGAGFGVDGSRVAIAGDSAGGNLAAAAALAARDAGQRLAAQLLIYPAVDARMTTPSHDLVGPFLTGKEMDWFYGHYQGDAEVSDWRLSPLLAPDHSGLPPALVITAEFDALRDEGEEYGTVLAKAGVETTVVRYPSMPHGFFKWGHRVGPARQAMIQASLWLGMNLRADGASDSRLYGVW